MFRKIEVLQAFYTISLLSKLDSIHLTCSFVGFAGLYFQ